MSNVVAGVVRGQIPCLEKHIEKKKSIYQKYKEGLKNLPISMNPFTVDIRGSNFWLSCMLIDEDAMSRQVRSNREVLYAKEEGRTCPTEIMQTLAEHNAEGCPIWKHMQPFYRMNGFVTCEGNGRAGSNAYGEGNKADVGSGCGHGYLSKRVVPAQ